MDKPKEAPARARWPYPLSSQEMNAAFDDYLNEVGNDGLSLLTLDELHDAIINVLLRQHGDPQLMDHRQRSPARKVRKRKDRLR